MKQAGEERDEAVGLAQQAQDAMTTQSSGQANVTAALQKQVAELTNLVAEQQKLIDQLQKHDATETGGVPPVLPDPNTGL